MPRSRRRLARALHDAAPAGPGGKAPDRFDTGRWSLYSLYPHPLPNVASSFYHALHINQLDAMHRIAPRPELAAVRNRLRNYADSPIDRKLAFAAKALFRLRVPRRGRHRGQPAIRLASLGRTPAFILVNRRQSAWLNWLMRTREPGSTSNAPKRSTQEGCYLIVGKRLDPRLRARQPTPEMHHGDGFEADLRDGFA